MDQTKSLFASRTIWGAAIALLATCAGLAGYVVSPADQADAADLVAQLGSIADRLVVIAGSAAAIWGRIKATHRVQ